MANERMFPNNLEAEECIFTHLMNNPSRLVSIADRLRPEHFYYGSKYHSAIYEAMLALSARGKPCTIMNVKNELSDAIEANDQLDYQLERYYNSVDAYQESLEEHVEAVIFCATMRKVIDAGSEMVQLAWTKDPNTITRAQELVYSLAMDGQSKPVAPLSDVMERYVSEFEARRRELEEGRPSGIPTGFPDLDRMLGGLRRSKLYVLAARPGYGKSALSLNIASNIVQNARHALFFSLEMDEGELAERLLSADMEMPQEFLRDADMDEVHVKRLKAHAKRMSHFQMEIDDRIYLLADIRNKALQANSKKPLDLIVVDYLQMMKLTAGPRSKNESRAEEIAELSRGLKKLARELHVPVLALAQMNRESERRGNALPQLSDLGESSGIEKDSDAVMFIYCDELQAEKREKNQPYELSIIVRKHRSGRMGTVQLKFRPRLTKFESADWEAPNDEAH
jgi:replicative DNA helicase